MKLPAAVRAALRGAWLLGAFFACAHATEVDRPPGEAGGARGERTRQAPRPSEPGHPPLAEAPEDLFVPGGVERIQQALAARGYLDLDAACPGTHRRRYLADAS